MTHLEEEFDEAARSLIGAYRVYRRLAGELVIERDQLKAELMRIYNLFWSRVNAGDTTILLDDLEDVLDLTRRMS